MPEPASAPPPLEPVIHDSEGRAYVPLKPLPRHMSLPLHPLDCLILRDGYMARAAKHLAAGQHSEWAECQHRAAGFLSAAQHLDPILQQLCHAEAGDALT